MKLTNILSGVRTMIVALSAVFFITACTDDQEMLEATEPVAQIEEVTAEVPVVEAEVASVTISGVYTFVTEKLDCATCTYTVADNVTVVDGAELKLAPGSIVCLSSGRKLGEVEFLNMIGTEAEPITIGTCE